MKDSSAFTQFRLVVRPAVILALAAAFGSPLLASGSQSEALAQNEAREPSSTGDGKWENLGIDTKLSADGNWLVAPISRVDGTSELRIFDLITPGEPIIAEEARDPVFSDDSRWLAYTVGYPESEREKLQAGKKPVRNKAGLLNLKTGDAELFENVASFAFGGGGAHLALHKYPPEQTRGNEAAAGSENTEDPPSADLLVRDLAAGTSGHFGSVAEYAWQEDGTLLALAISASDRAGNGIQLFNSATGALRILASGDVLFTGLSWREDEDDLAAFRSREHETYEEPTHLVLAWRGLAEAGEGTKLNYDHGEDPDFPAAMRVVDYRELEWSDDAQTLFFGIQEWHPKPAGESEEGGSDEKRDNNAENDDEAADGIEPADVEVWHSFDERVIPMQKVQEEQDRKRNYLSAWHVEEGRLVPLGTDGLETVTLLEGHQLATETDREPYRTYNMFNPRRLHDIWLIDVRSGDRKKVIEGVTDFYGGSVAGRYLLYFKEDHYWTYDIETGTHASITAGLPTLLVNDEYDTPERTQKPPWGIAGWLESDAAVLLHDEYDLWSVSSDGSGGVKLTDGRATQIQHRYVNLEPGQGPLFFSFGISPETVSIDPDEPLYLSLYGKWTKQYGYGRLHLTTRAGPGADADSVDSGGQGGPDSDRGQARPVSAAYGVEVLIWLDKNVDRLAKAEDAEVYSYAVQGFDDSPDIFIGGPDLGDGRQVTSTNPFQDDYAWGRSELIDYETGYGRRLQGALYYPAAYEPGRQYPMIVYIYERLSQNVHNYTVPSERSPYNTTVFANQGYFVLQPDIVFRGRETGPSALECVEAAVKKVLETGMVDPLRVGLVGHSMGGYESSFIATQSKLFAAVVSGAPLTNFFSMFGTIHWTMGLPETSHFETGQARMEVPYWEDIDAYVRNSPVIFVHEMDTPLLVFFGDKDGTVDWHQGVELYNYARRAGKFLVMLVYPGEGHGARRKPNQIDYHRRVLQWFDHFLKGEQAPKWITRGVTVLERERELKQALESSSEEEIP